MLLYRLLVSLFAGFALTRAMRRGGWRALRDRLARGDDLPEGPHVWLHGASNGELASARPVLEMLIGARPDLHWVVTCNSDTGTALVDGWHLAQVTARPAPIDLARVSRRALRRWRVVALVSLEAELWPHRVLDCPGPVVQLAARMSANTARNWARVPGLAAKVLGAMSFVSAQNAETLERLRALGLPGDAAGPVADLKALYTPPDLPPDPALVMSFAREATWLAASTHPGEEQTVLEAHHIARQADPDLRLILAPRHPQRAGEIAEMARARGLTVARRSLSDPPGDAAVYLADTMGEMARWYALAGRVFIGGTLTDRGGHTPYEPAAFGAALLAGPDVANFKAPFARLRAAGAVAAVRDAATLAQALEALKMPEAQAAAGHTAQQALQQQTDLGGLVAQILSVLPPPGRT